MSRRKYLLAAGISTFGGGLTGCIGSSDDQGPSNERWTFEVDGGNPSSPAVADGTVYVGGDKLYAIDADSGEKKWTINPRGHVESPVIMNDFLYFSSQAIDVSGAGVEDITGIVHRADPDTGELEWQYTTALHTQSPAVAEGTVYTTASDPAYPPNPKAYAIDAQNGTKKWSRSIRTCPSPPVAADGSVYFTGDYMVYAINKSGNKRWDKDTFSSSDVHPISFANGTVYYGDDGGDIHALNSADGRLQWDNSIGDSKITSVSSVVEGTLYITNKNTLHKMDAEGGTSQWEFNPDGSLKVACSIKSKIGIGDNSIYFGTEGGIIYSVDAKDGSLRWQYETDGKIDTAPTAKNGTVYMVNDGSKVYALNERL